MRHKGILIVISGFSGAGKGTLMKKLVREYDNYALSISATTRACSKLLFYIISGCSVIIITITGVFYKPVFRNFLLEGLLRQKKVFSSVFFPRSGRPGRRNGIEEYDYIVVNDDLESCVKELHEIILAAHNTPFRNEEFIEKIREELKVLAKGEK